MVENSEQAYLQRALRVAAVGAIVLAGVLFFLTRGVAPRPPHPRLIEVECIEIERGPTLRFAKDGTVKSDGSLVGTYKFKEASPGKYGPSIHVENINVSEAQGRVQVQLGKQGWFWFFTDDDTVELVASERIVRGRRCGTASET